jgi:hypothetical protein
VLCAAQAEHDVDGGQGDGGLGGVGGEDDADELLKRLEWRLDALRLTLDTQQLELLVVRHVNVGMDRDNKVAPEPARGGRRGVERVEALVERLDVGHACHDDEHARDRASHPLCARRVRDERDGDLVLQLGR